MEFVVVSDNHGKIEPLEYLRMAYPHADAYLHCGDSELPPNYLTGYYTVAGNNDTFYNYENERVIEIKDLRILLTHGHNYSYQKRIEQLFEKAKKLHCQLVCFGHTHSFYYEERDGICLVNPGSIYYNRDGSKPSYAIVTYDDGKFTVERKEYSGNKKTSRLFFK